MPIISVWDNENNRWKRNEKKNEKKNKQREIQKKDRKEQGGTEAIVKEWELNDFFVQVRFPPINM